MSLYFKLQREKDFYLMDRITNDISRRKLKEFNQCRINLHVMMIYGIMESDGITVNKGIFNGNITCNRKYEWPYIK